ncbi:hypothetical protein [Roseovarius sp. Pro17]|uniref:hypothetical protein n=1 Tax=Roseovarius sp. Pro17 TaxID=3108175 RepID=UPI002D77F808|nr:hypothetical protein [Roseovarius sp. Pro17]
MTFGALRLLTVSAASASCLAGQLAADPWGDFRAFCLPDGKALGQTNTGIEDAGWITGGNVTPELVSAYVILSEPGVIDQGMAITDGLVPPDLSAFMQSRAEWAAPALAASVESGEILTSEPYILRRRSGVENGLAMVECKLFSSSSDTLAAADDLAASVAGSGQLTDHIWWSQIAIPNRAAILELSVNPNIEGPVANVEVVRFDEFASVHTLAASGIEMKIGVHALTIFKA